MLQASEPSTTFRSPIHLPSTVICNPQQLGLHSALWLSGSDPQRLMFRAPSHSLKRLALYSSSGFIACFIKGSSLFFFAKPYTFGVDTFLFLACYRETRYNNRLVNTTGEDFEICNVQLVMHSKGVVNNVTSCGFCLIPFCAVLVIPPWPLYAFKAHVHPRAEEVTYIHEGNMGTLLFPLPSSSF